MRPTLALALMSALTGCVAAPRGPHAEYRTGMTPVAPPAPVTASYMLHSSGATVEVRHAQQGQPVGFARNPDGSVSAVAPGFDLPITSSSYAWEVIRERVEGKPSLFRRGLSGVGDRLGRIALPLILLAGTAAYAVAASNSHR